MGFYGIYPLVMTNSLRTGKSPSLTGTETLFLWWLSSSQTVQLNNQTRIEMAFGSQILFWLVVSALLKNMSSSTGMMKIDEIPNIWQNHPNVPNHQLVFLISVRCWFKAPVFWRPAPPKLITGQRFKRASGQRQKICGAWTHHVTVTGETTGKNCLWDLIQW